MIRRSGHARLALRPGTHAAGFALLPGLIAAGITHGACLAIASNPDGERLAAVVLPQDDPSFVVTYLHSVTRTPVEERYRVDDETIVETGIRFEEHGPGLPTEPDAGAQWTRRDGHYVVTVNRRFPRVVMRIDGSTHPTLAASARIVDLAQWGNRALVLEALSGPCARP
jgi:hypothetical protein